MEVGMGLRSAEDVATPEDGQACGLGGRGREPGGGERTPRVLAGRQEETGVRLLRGDVLVVPLPHHAEYGLLDGIEEEVYPGRRPEGDGVVRLEENHAVVREAEVLRVPGDAYKLHKRPYWL